MTALRPPGQRGCGFKKMQRQRPKPRRRGGCSRTSFLNNVLSNYPGAIAPPLLSRRGDASGAPQIFSHRNAFQERQSPSIPLSKL